MGRLAQAALFRLMPCLHVERPRRPIFPLIRSLAGVAFPATYRELLSPAQLDYMMEWMYSEQSLREQLRGGHVFYIASCDGEPCGYVSSSGRANGCSTCRRSTCCPASRGAVPGPSSSARRWRMSGLCSRRPAAWS